MVAADAMADIANEWNIDT